MTSRERKLLDEALRLPVEARAAMAGSLLESLDQTVDEDSEAAWAAEIARRVKEINEGKAKLIPWAEARRTILGQ